MTAYFGDYNTTQTVHIPFNTFTSDDPSASVTVTNLVAGDIKIHKDGAVAERTSANGVTVSIDFDTITGNHMVNIDLSDNTHAGFYSAGSHYQVRLEGITVDAATLNVWIGTFSIGCIAAAVWNAVRSSHVTAGTFGEAVGTQILLAGTASAGSSTSITLTGGVATTGYYNGCLCIITGGTGVGQARTILSYTSGTVATVTRDWAVAPSTDSKFIVVGDDVAGILEAGTAQAGAASTITLDAAASGTSEIYNKNYVMITGGAGVGQTRLITTYNGGNQIATITPNWVTNPAAGSVYQILPGGRVDVGQWLGTGCAAPTVAGVPEVDVTYVAGAAQADIPTAAQVNAQVVDALNVDTYAEPAQGAPPETASIVQKLSYLYKYWRNKVVTSSSSIEVYNDAGAVVDHKSAIADDATDFTKDEFISGP
jgi:hypothetical protein